MDKQIAFVSFLAENLDNKFSFLGLRFGLASIIDFIPGFGDVFDTVLSLYIVYIALLLKLPTFRIIQMMSNIAINFTFGAIPLIGGFVYAFNKANLKNVRIIKEYRANLSKP